MSTLRNTGLQTTIGLALLGSVLAAPGEPMRPAMCLSWRCCAPRSRPVGLPVAWSRPAMSWRWQAQLNTLLAQDETGELELSGTQVALFDERVLHEAEEAQRASVRSYDEGKASYLEVFGAQRTLLETWAEYADILFAYREASAALDRAMGGDLPE